jgi:hypothetical protein
MSQPRPPRGVKEILPCMLIQLRRTCLEVGVSRIQSRPKQIKIRGFYVVQWIGRTTMDIIILAHGMPVLYGVQNS